MNTQRPDPEQQKRLALEEIAAEEAKAERKERNARLRELAAKETEEAKEDMRRVRMSARKAIIAQYDYRCQTCNERKEGLRQWVVNLEDETAVCRSCWAKPIVTPKTLTYPVIWKERDQWILWGEMLDRALRECGISRREFARKSGWSLTRVSALCAYEGTHMKAAGRPVKEATADRIVGTLRHMGITLLN